MLGSLEVRTDAGVLADVPGARLRGLLIALALEPGHAVPKATLIDWIWGERPPSELTETAGPHLRRAEQLEWLATLKAEHDRPTVFGFGGERQGNTAYHRRTLGLRLVDRSCTPFFSQFHTGASDALQDNTRTMLRTCAVSNPFS
jgi:hypothetical protein